MVLVQLKSMPVQITILFLFAVVWAIDVEATDSTDPSKEDSKNQTIFLTRREACDFLRIGDMFENPEHHMDLAYEYLYMEETGYWGLRCEEKKARGDAVERLGYCA